MPGFVDTNAMDELLLEMYIRPQRCRFRSCRFTLKHQTLLALMIGESHNIASNPVWIIYILQTRILCHGNLNLLNIDKMV